MIRFYQNDLYSDPTAIPKLEKEFSRYTGFKYGVAVNSCTSAIALCLEYEKPKIASIPAMTYASVANEIIRSGSTLHLDDDWKAGYAYRLGGTDIIDSAHSVVRKTIHDGKDKFCYSFYPTKLVPSYEGGMICTDDKEFYDWAILNRQMGRTGYGAYYDIKYAGAKYNMTPIQAREALRSLRRLPEVIKRNRQICKLYAKEFGGRFTDHLAVIFVCDGYMVREKMLVKGIECSWHFEPLYRKTFYANYYQRDEFGYCDTIANGIVSLPMYPTMTDKQVRQVIKAIKEI